MMYPEKHRTDITYISATEDIKNLQQNWHYRIGAFSAAPTEN